MSNDAKPIRLRYVLIVVLAVILAVIVWQMVKTREPRAVDAEDSAAQEPLTVATDDDTLPPADSEDVAEQEPPTVITDDDAVIPPAAEQIAEAKIYTDWPFDAAEAKRRQEETAQRLGIPVEKTIDLGGGVRLEMVLIPAGEFMMGGDQSAEEVSRLGGGILEWYQGEHPQRRVRITQPFYMGKHEVTQAQYERLTGKNPSNFKGANLPVEQVSWNDAQQFITRLNGLNQGTSRLPTEAEWEYSCRAGTSTPFYFGSTISTDQANYNGNFIYGAGQKGTYRQRTTPVGSFPSNAWGLYEMHGNVWEWVSDRWQNHYRGLETTDPTGPRTGEYRVLRGGSWNVVPKYCRSASRLGPAPDSRDLDRGLRVASPAR